jgi:hypothetical protein
VGLTDEHQKSYPDKPVNFDLSFATKTKSEDEKGESFSE